MKIRKSFGKNPPNSVVLKMSTEFSLLVVSNRLPFTVRRDVDGGVRRVPAAGGLVTAVAPVVIQTKGNILLQISQASAEDFSFGEVIF